MNINKHVENRGKNKVKAIAVPRFWMGHKIYLASLTPIFMTISVVRRTTLMSLNIDLNKHIYMIQNYIVSTPALSVMLKNRVYSQKYSYTNSSMLWNTIIGLIVMQGPSDFTYYLNR